MMPEKEPPNLISVYTSKINTYSKRNHICNIHGNIWHKIFNTLELHTSLLICNSSQNIVVKGRNKLAMRTRF